MLQQNEPDDFVIATDIQHSVRDFIIKAAEQLDIHLTWKGKGTQEKGYDQSGHCIIEIDPRYFRPAEVDSLLGNASKAKAKLGWTPKITFDELVREMVEEDLRIAKKDYLIKQNGFTVFEPQE